MGTKILIPSPNNQAQGNKQDPSRVTETILFQDQLCLVPCWYTLKRQDVIGHIQHRTPNSIIINCQPLYPPPTVENTPTSHPTGARDGLLELETRPAPPEITALYPDKRDLIVSPVKWEAVAARMLLLDQTYYKRMREDTADGTAPKPIDFDEIERANKKIRSGILCRSSQTTLDTWLTQRLSSARTKMDQQYRPGEQDESLPAQTTRPTRPQWRTKRRLTMPQILREEERPPSIKRVRDKPMKWTPLQKLMFENSVQASIDDQQGPAELMVNAVAAARMMSTEESAPHPEEKLPNPQPIDQPPLEIVNTAPGTLTPNPNLTWRRWEQMTRTLGIKSGTRVVAEIWALRLAQPRRTLNLPQMDCLKEAEATIALARDHLNRTHKRLQTDNKLRAMPDQLTLNKEWDEDRCLTYRKAQQAKPRRYPTPQATTAHYTELFQARLTTAVEAHQQIERSMGPQTVLQIPTATDQHNRTDIFLGSLTVPENCQLTTQPIPPPSTDPYPLDINEYTEQDLNIAWGTKLREAWDQRLLQSSRPACVTSEILYIWKLMTDKVKKRRHTCQEIEAEERRYEAKARQRLGLELQNQEIVFSLSSSSASSSASSAPPPASEPWRIPSERCLVVLLLFCELMLDSAKCVDSREGKK
eukprot:g38293.t1